MKTDNPIRSGNGAGPEGKRRDCVRAAHQKYAIHFQQRRSAQNFRHQPGRRRANRFDARHLRGQSQG